MNRPLRLTPCVSSRCGFTLSLLLLAASVSFLPPGPMAREFVITRAGAGPDNLPAVQSNLGWTTSVAVHPGGGFVLSNFSRVYRVDTQGRLHHIGGSSFTCDVAPYGDGLPARSACFKGISGLAVTSSGDILVADSLHDTIRRIDARTGIVSKFAGRYASAFGGDGGPADNALMSHPRGLRLDAAGNVFLADRFNNRVRRIDAATGIITTVAGNGAATGPLGDDGPALSASLSAPLGVAVGPGGHIYIADHGHHRVRRVDAATGLISTVAGDGSHGWTGDAVDATLTGLAGPMHVAFDLAGNLLIADSWEMTFPLREIDMQNHRVRRVEAATGLIFTVAGSDLRGYYGDGQSADGAGLYHPTDLGVTAQGDILIADQYNLRVRRVSGATNIITTAAGNGDWGASGDGFDARLSSLDPLGMRFDPSGNLVVCDGNSRIRKLDAATGLIATIAGNGVYDSKGDGGSALNASFQYPYAVDFDAQGNLFVLDPDASTVRRIDRTTGIVTRVAGAGYGFGGDGGPALDALFGNPEGIAVASNGDIYVADTENQRIRRIRNGNITTVAGTGFRTGGLDGPGGDPADDLGDGGPAADVSFFNPQSIHFDAAGRLLIVDYSNSRIRRWDLGAGVITTVAGDGVARYAGDGGPATAASLNNPWDVAPDAAGNLFISDNRNHRIRRVDAVSGLITTVGGDGTDTFGPDGSAALGAGLTRPGWIAIDPDGMLHFSSGGRVRSLATAPVASGRVPDGGDPAADPLQVERAAGGDLFLWWSPSCTFTDNDYVIYEGVLGGWSSHAPLLCSTGGATGVGITPSAGDRYYIVVPRNPLREGSLGIRSDGSPRPEGASSCLPRLEGGSCP